MLATERAGVEAGLRVEGAGWTLGTAPARYLLLLGDVWIETSSGGRLGPAAAFSAK